jgi:hypothetical protein
MRLHHESDCTIDCWTGVRTLKQLNQMLEKAYADYDKAKTNVMKAHYRALIQRIEAGIDSREAAI